MDPGMTRAGKQGKFGVAVVMVTGIWRYPMVTAGDVPAVLDQSGDLGLELLVEDLSSFGQRG